MQAAIAGGTDSSPPPAAWAAASAGPKREGLGGQGSGTAVLLQRCASAQAHAFCDKGARCGSLVICERNVVQSGACCTTCV